eukprot:6459321-Amphidinium_carterae.1
MFRFTTGRAFRPHDLRHVPRGPALAHDTSLVDAPRQPVGGEVKTGSTSSEVVGSPRKLEVKEGSMSSAIMGSPQ